jgi:putative membrane protein
MSLGAVYCGAPPLPGTLLDRFNLDPRLLLALALIAAIHLYCCNDAARGRAAAGWATATAAFVSPLCALSVSLFSARIGQHMILLLVAAPLIASALRDHKGRGLGGATALFAAALWFWHMPAPYAATFGSPAIYWAMHASLFGSAILLWRTLLGHDALGAPAALAAGTITSIQMGLLGAIIALAQRPLFAPHYLTTEAWGLTPLADQQLGGLIMWVPGCLFFLWAAMWSLRTIWRTLEPAR